MLYWLNWSHCQASPSEWHSFTTAVYGRCSRQAYVIQGRHYIKCSARYCGARGYYIHALQWPGIRHVLLCIPAPVGTPPVFMMTCVLLCNVKGVTGPPFAVDYLGAFKAKLQLHGSCRPGAAAISCLTCHFPQQRKTMAQAQASSDVSAPLASHPQLMTGVDLHNNSLLILKLLPPCTQQQKQAAPSERLAIQALGLDPKKVPW